VALETGADVVKLVEDGDELVVEVLIEEARQAEGHQVEHLALADEVTLHLVGAVAAMARQGAIAEAQRRHPRLQAVWPAGTGWGGTKRRPRRVDVAQFGTAAGDVVTQPADVAAEVKGLIARPRVEPRRRFQTDPTASRSWRHADRPQWQRVVRLLPAQN